jgi:O-antigen/teichoic acid export membrane protein
MSILQRARKNIILKFISEALIRSLALVFVIVTARYLGDRDYGRFSLAYFMAGLLTVFVDLGLNTVMIRDVSRDHRLLSTYAGNILSLKTVISCILLLLGPLLLYPAGYPKGLIFMVLLSMVYLQVNHLLDFMVAVTNSLEKMEYELLIKGLYKVLVVAVPLLFLWLGYGLWALLLSLAGTYGLSCLLSGVIVWKKITPLRPRWNTALWKQLLRTAWPIGLSGLFMTVYVRIDLVMLSLFGTSPAEIGWYAVPVKIIEMFSLFPMLIMAGLFPIFTVLQVSDPEAFKKNYQRAVTYLALTAVPLTLAGLFLSDPWLVFFFGPAFARSVPSLRILIWVIPFVFLNYVLINTLVALNREKMITWGSASAVVFNIGINLIILPRYGYLGASWTTVVTEVLLAGGFFWILQHSFFRLPLMETALKIMISGLLMAVPLWALKSFHPALIWPAAFIFYGLGLVSLRLLTHEDWLLLKRSLSRFSIEPMGELR